MAVHVTMTGPSWVVSRRVVLATYALKSSSLEMTTDGSPVQSIVPLIEAFLASHAGRDTRSAAPVITAGCVA